MRCILTHGEMNPPPYISQLTPLCLLRIFFFMTVTLPWPGGV